MEKRTTRPVGALTDEDQPPAPVRSTTARQRLDAHIRKENQREATWERIRLVVYVVVFCVAFFLSQCGGEEPKAWPTSAAGTYVSELSSISEAYRFTLVLEPGGTFRYTCDGPEHLRPRPDLTTAEAPQARETTGEWRQDDSTLYLTVTYRNVSSDGAVTEGMETMIATYLGDGIEIESGWSLDVLGLVWKVDRLTRQADAE